MFSPKHHHSKWKENLEQQLNQCKSNYKNQQSSLELQLLPNKKPMCCLRDERNYHKAMTEGFSFPLFGPDKN